MNAKHDPDHAPMPAALSGRSGQDHGGAGRVDGSRPAAVRHAELAWHLATVGLREELAVHVGAALLLASSLPRRDRHAVSILTLAAEGHTSRAAGLAAEHLRDFPGDALIARVAQQLAGRQQR
jgi:hypothetical protein